MPVLLPRGLMNNDIDPSVPRATVETGSVVMFVHVSGEITSLAHAVGASRAAAMSTAQGRVFEVITPNEAFDRSRARAAAPMPPSNVVRVDRRSRRAYAPERRALGVVGMIGQAFRRSFAPRPLVVKG